MNDSVLKAVFSAGTDNLRRLLDRMRAWEPGGDWIPREGRESFEQSRRAWLLLAEAGLAELRAEEEPPGSPAKRERQDRAGALYREASLTAPGATDAEFLLQGFAYERNLESAQGAAARGDDATLLASLRRAAAHPLHGAGHLHLANALAVRGQWAEALEEFERSVAKSPRSADAHLRLALLAYGVQDYGRARRAFEAACALRPDRPPLYRELLRLMSGG